MHYKTEIFFQRAVELAKQDLPHSAINDALFALSLQEYQDKRGASMIFGFLAQLHSDIRRDKKS